MRLKKKLGSRTFVEVQFIINKFNQNEIEKIKKFAKKAGIDKLHLKTFGLLGFLYSKKKRKKLLKKFVPTRLDVDKRFSEDCSISIKKVPVCRSPRTTASVTIEGDLVICCDDFQALYKYGNLLKSNIKDILNSEKAKNIIRQGEERKLPICKNCTYITR
jgi:radical SAM protein with 4Fe4S-binding SPASM domain